MINRPDNYEVKDALDVLIKAEEIKKNPSLLDEVLKYAGSQKAAISSIEDLKAARDAAIEKDNSPEEGSQDEESQESSEEAKAEEVDSSLENVDPLLEENTYINRVDRANKEASAPSEIPLVKVVKE